MKVNKKRLAEIFNVDPRTIERWQSQGLPCASKGSKGIESVFDTAMAIQWYAQRETDIENEKLRKELDDLRAAAESDLQPGSIDYERYRLTKAQADAQELKNAREDGVVLETELFTFILQRVATKAGERQKPLRPRMTWLTGNTPHRTLRQHKKELSSSVVQPTAHLKRLLRHRKQ